MLKTNKVAVLFFSVLLANTASLGYPSAAFSFQHPRYTIDATIDVARKTMTAKETVVVTNNSDQSTREVFFHIYPNRKFTDKEKNFMLRYAGYFKINSFPDGFQSGKVTVQSMNSQGQDLPYQIQGEDETLLKVLLNRDLKSGESVELSINFTVMIPHAYGRFGWHENIIALSRFYPILFVLDKNGWNHHPFYPYHRPFFSDAAEYTVRLTVPANQNVIHSGQRENETQNTDGTKTISISTSSPIREFSLALSPDYRMVETSVGAVKIKSFYLPGDDRHAQEALSIAKDVVEFYTQQFGPYPYEEFSIAPVYLGYGGEQMSNMIFIDTRVYQLPQFLSRYFDFLISHETGHQWFYNVVGVDGFKEMWLEEGVNSYFNLQYLENKYGRDATIVELPEALNWLLPNFSFRRGRDYRYKIIARTTWDQPVTGELSSFTEPASIFSITYGKGSMVVSMLRHLVTEETFRRIFTRVFREYKFKNISTQDFVTICQQESGRDLTAFFDQWLTTAKKLDVAVKGVDGNVISIENRGAIVMPVDVEVEFVDGSKEELLWEENVSAGTIQTQNQWPIRQVRLDPDDELLDIDRTNNVWPRDLNVKFVPLYIGLYDMPLFLPEDSYNLVIGPEAAGGGLGVKASLQKPFDWNFYAASDYDFNDSLLKSRLGYQLNFIDHSFRTAGFELFNIDDQDGGEEDLAGGKVYVRQELWPTSYGLTDINDHVTFYLIRDRSLNQGWTLGGFEDSRNASYLKKDEAIIGGLLHLGRSGTYPDPSEGYKVDALLESSNHMLGATQYFYRGSIDWAGYHPVTPKSKLALRLKYGWGYPLDKNLYELGGMEGLRGYDRKTLRGARMGLGSFEYRFPIKEGLRWKFFDHIFGVESLGGVIFVDAGQSWFNDISDTGLKKDAGLGLRATVSIGSFLEKVLVRFDVAEPIGDSTEDTHYWFGVGHAF